MRGHGTANWLGRTQQLFVLTHRYEILTADALSQTQPLLALINLELALSNFAQVEALFGQALKGSSGEITAAADVSVWSGSFSLRWRCRSDTATEAYLHYIRRQNPVAEGSQGIEQARTTITNAYEFALKECGTDRESGEIWQEYISFIADATVSLPGSISSDPVLMLDVAEEHLGDASTGRQPAQDVSTRSLHPAEQRRAIMACLRRVRERNEQAHRMSTCPLARKTSVAH